MQVNVPGRLVRLPRSIRIAFCTVACAALVSASAQTTTPPTAPTNVIATAANCGQINLSWGASTDFSGTGLNRYNVQRSDGINVAVSTQRTWLDDTNGISSGATITYNVVAQDNAGNQSQPSNSVTVATPASCPMTAGEQIITPTAASNEPLGKTLATWGSRTAYLYLKRNSGSTLDTWIYVKDSDSGLTSNFLLHTYPGYSMTETDALLASANDLWALARSSGGQVQVSHYQLNGSSIPNSALLLSTQLFGDSNSTPASMIRLKSGALVIAWNEDGLDYASTDLTAGFAYYSPTTGIWTSQFPATITNSYGGNRTLTQMSMAQHPADGSLWVFAHRDAFHQIIALHFTESGGAISLDWTNVGYIAQSIDGINGPETEFPFLSAIADPTRNAILLAYQRNDFDFVFLDSRVNNDSYKEASVAIAQIAADGSKTFIPFPTYIERQQQFGFSVLSDGTLWLAYHPIDHQTLTWNEVYATNYSAGSWSSPALVGLNYNFYNSIGPYRNPGLVTYRTDQPLVAFRTPDQKIHSFDLNSLGPAPLDTTPPTTSITSPSGGAAVSGITTITAIASDNIGVIKVDFLLDGNVVASGATAPYNFAWNSTTVANGSHLLQTKAYDAAGNAGSSALINVTVNNQASALAVAITNPSNGSTVPRGQQVKISAAANDVLPVTQMQFMVNNTLLCTTKIAPYACNWKVPNKKGSYKVQAQGTDTAGNTAAQTVTVTAQ